MFPEISPFATHRNKKIILLFNDMGSTFTSHFDATDFQVDVYK